MNKHHNKSLRNRIVSLSYENCSYRIFHSSCRWLFVIKSISVIFHNFLQKMKIVASDNENIQKIKKNCTNIKRFGKTIEFLEASCLEYKKRQNLLLLRLSHPEVIHKLKKMIKVIFINATLLLLIFFAKIPISVYKNIFVSINERPRKYFHLVFKFLFFLFNELISPGFQFSPFVVSHLF